MITGKTLIDLGYPQGPIIGAALRLANTEQGQGAPFEDVLANLETIRKHPEMFMRPPFRDNGPRSALAEAWQGHYRREAEAELSRLHDVPLPYDVFADGLTLDAGAYAQMDVAMRVPVAVAGALMPDAHQGYGLPIGGVWALRGAVSPNAVGSDIGCQVNLTAFWEQPRWGELKAVLERHTYFNFDVPKTPYEHPVLDDPVWNTHPFFKQHAHLRDVARGQLGTSGEGNHFCEFGLYIGEGGPHLALLTHSGSRALGAKVAAYYHKLALKRRYTLPHEAQDVAWLLLDEEEGGEYLEAMSYAVRYATANHEIIHGKMQSVLGLASLTHVHSVHNVAMYEEHENELLVVHRKGATPAAKGERGIIPSSMTKPSYVVVGLGNPDSLNSASHGAGRAMSRKRALETLTREDMEDELEHANVTLIGGDLDEAPQAYKDPTAVMNAQRELVTVVNKFIPRVVRMAESQPKPWQK